MAHFNFTQPHKKKKVTVKRDSPFPVPIATVTGKPISDENWFYYTGELHNDHVNVYHSGDSHFLYTMGFFGKGNLSSRGKPEFSQRGLTVKLPDDRREAVKVMERRRYLLHEKWATGEKAGSEIVHAEIKDTDDSLGDITMEHSAISLPETEHRELSPPVTIETIETEVTQGVKTANKEQTLRVKEDSSLNWEALASEWDTQSGDEDFWACAEDSKQNPGDRDTGAQAQLDGVTDVPGLGNNTATVQCDTNTSDRDFRISKSHDSERRGIPPSSPDYQEQDGVSKSHDSQTRVIFALLPDCRELDGVSRSHDSQDRGVPSLSPNSQETDVSCGKSQVTKDMEFGVSNTSEGENKTIDESVSIQKTDLENSSMSDDVQNLSDDSEGDVLLIDNIDSHKTRRKRRHSFFPVCRKDPFPVEEFLMLTLEEAFFLSYGLGCLVLFDETKTALGLTDLWKRFCALKLQFLPHYIAYHHFRSKGWVPKNGTKFGVDLILYKEGPPFYHGSYSTIVRFVEEGTLTEIPKYTSRRLSWTSLSGLSRLTEQVGKELLVCYVIKPSGLSEEEMLSPKCISQFKVQEVLLSRWVSGQEREKKFEEIP